jgi:dihydrofolate synthase/folylpolyglutamate synthase
MQKKHRGGAAKIPVTLSVLAAIGIILGKFLAFNVTDFMRFSFENTTIIFAGIVFGPVLGAVVGIVQDLVGCLAVGYAINPLITLGCATIGAVSGIVFRMIKRAPLPARIGIATLLSHLAGSVLIKTLGLSLVYGSPFIVTMLWRLLNYAIVGFTEVVLLCFLLKSKQLLAQINKIIPFSTNQKFKSTSEASDFAKNVSGVFSKPGLERVTTLLDALGSPEKQIKAVHITGTNGKGSTSAMLTGILKASGLKVGSFNSPYLLEMREAIRIDGEPISENALLSLFDRLRPIADESLDKPTEFELLTAAAYLYFKEENVDVAVIECGMGAKRDATNVIDAPLLSVITGIAKDHTSFLGSTLTEIATEKSGVIKRGCPVLVGEMPPEALEVIKGEANRLGAEMCAPDTPTVKSFAITGTIIDVGGITDVKIPLLGVHQPKNASLAISAANILKKRFSSITNDTIRNGIRDTVWRGRFEVLSESPVFIFDGAHNLDGVKSAVESIKTYFDEKIVCLTGVLADKEYEEMAREISSVADTVITITPDSPRALSAEDYASVLAQNISHVLPAGSISEGVKMALDIAKEKSVPIVCLGSLYLYKDIIKCKMPN